ncbi:MAG: hypothetical protein WCG42_10490, partial [Parachlamydiaceae bacterium]
MTTPSEPVFRFPSINYISDEIKESFTPVVVKGEKSSSARTEEGNAYAFTFTNKEGIEKKGYYHPPGKTKDDDRSRLVENTSLIIERICKNCPSVSRVYLDFKKFHILDHTKSTQVLLIQDIVSNLLNPDSKFDSDELILLIQQVVATERLRQMNSRNQYPDTKEDHLKNWEGTATEKAVVAAIQEKLTNPMEPKQIKLLKALIQKVSFLPKYVSTLNVGSHNTSSGDFDTFRKRNLRRADATMERETIPKPTTFTPPGTSQTLKGVFTLEENEESETDDAPIRSVTS